MTLREYLKKRKMTQAEFAKLISSDQAHVSELVNGKTRPSIRTTLLIHKATKGTVSLMDWGKK